MSLLHNLPGCVTEKKTHFRDNGSSLTGEVKHIPIRFVKYLLRIPCFLVLKSLQILWKIPTNFFSLVVLQAVNMKLYKTELHCRCF